MYNICYGFPHKENVNIFAFIIVEDSRTHFNPAASATTSLFLLQVLLLARPASVINVYHGS